VNILDALGIINVILGIGQCAPTFKPIVNADVLTFCESLRPYLAGSDFVQLMAMVRAEMNMPEQFVLFQSYPNPFNPSTDIRYQIPDLGYSVHTTLKVFNILGEEVATLVDEIKKPGYYTVSWDGSDMASGVYFCFFETDYGSMVTKMVLMR
jgi:hypothetical protein